MEGLLYMEGEFTIEELLERDAKFRRIFIDLLNKIPGDLAALGYEDEIEELIR